MAVGAGKTRPLVANAANGQETNVEPPIASARVRQNTDTISYRKDTDKTITSGRARQNTLHSEPPPQVLHCPTGHPVTKHKEKVRWHQFQTLAKGCRCALCNRSLSRNESRWRCHYSCDHNVCDACYEGASVTAALAPVPTIPEVDIADAPQADASIADAPAADVPLPAEPAPPPAPIMEDAIYLTGPWKGGDWKLETKAKLLPCPGAPPGMLRMCVCVKLTSQSFSFQVVAPSQDWNWRLYPRDGKNHFGTHVNSQGIMVAGNKNKVIVGVGDKKKGHALNMHVIDFDQKTREVIVTIYIELPVKPGIESGNIRLDTTTEPREPCRAWFENAESEPIIEAGDGYDIDKYRSKFAAAA